MADTSTVEEGKYSKYLAIFIFKIKDTEIFNTPTAENFEIALNDISV